MAKKTAKLATKAPRNTASKGRAKGAGRAKKVASGEFIISKSRTKAAAGINVSGEFYAALDGAVRKLISTAEARAVDNGRKTLRPYDL